MKPIRVTRKTRARALILLGCLLLVLLLLLGRGAGGHALFAGTDASGTDERVRFLAECGWTADPASEQAQVIHIPEAFPPVFEDYNELQIQQGYDLHDYAGRDCDLYTYAVTNWPDETQTVLANLYVYRGRVIGGDIHSTNLDGFMIALT